MTAFRRTRTLMLTAALAATALVGCGAPAAPGLFAGEGALEASARRASFKAFVANERSGTVSVVDTGTGKLIKTLDVGSKPSSMAVTPDGSMLLVANRGGSTLSIFDVDSMSLSATLRTSKGPAGVAVSPGGTYAVVACAKAGVLDIVNLGEKKITNRVSVGADPVAAAISPEADFVYVANAGDGTVTKINFDTEKVVDVFEVGKRPVALAVKSGERLYVANAGENTIGAISTVSGETVARISTGGGFLTGYSRPAEMALNPAGTKLFVANGGKKHLTVIDTMRNAVEGEIRLPAPAGGVAVTPNGRYALAAQLDGTASLINLNTMRALQKPIRIGLEPTAVVIAGNGDDF